MTYTTPNLMLPYIMAAQAQKHVTHNEAIRLLDVLVQTAIVDRDLASPPTAPADGVCYIVAAGATGAWAGHDGKVAAFQDGGWVFLAPAEGWVAWIGDEDLLAVWNGVAWVAAGSGAGLNPTPLLGVNTTADTTNRLAVAAPATLLTHSGGGHQIKVNKNAAADTASLLFQTGFSGRAEIGTTGTDDFKFKVSADGAAWTDAIVINRTSGSVSFPNTSLGGTVALEDEGAEVVATATRINFAGAGVSVTNAGSGEATVTIPGTGGTGNVPAGGSTGQILAKASATDFATAWIAAPSGGASYTMHTDGIVSEWRFLERSGTTVADARGSNTIDLTAAVASDPAWTARGLWLEGDCVQTPAIAGVKTVAFAYRVKRGEQAGFLAQYGSLQMLGDNVSVPAGVAYHVGGGAGVAPLRYRSNGTFATRLNRGGWQLAFAYYNQSVTQKIGFGGRPDLTTSRSAEFEIGWAACWNDELTAAEKSTVYNGVRTLLGDRGLYIDSRDCPETVDAALLWGQSNADGRALITDLSATDQARTRMLNTLIAPASTVSDGWASPELLVMGHNQKAPAAGAHPPATKFGPEMGAAWRREDAHTVRVRRLLINKFGVGSSYLAPSTTGVAAGATWNVTELPSSGLYYFALKHWWDTEHRLLAQGIGPRLRALWWMQGEQDATGTAYSASYQGNLQALWDQLQVDTGTTVAMGLKAVVARIRDQDPTMNATAKAEVRAAQAAFVTANGAAAALIDTDTYPLSADLVHYTAAGQKSLGQAFYDAVTW